MSALTDREKMVLLFVDQRRSIREMAKELYVGIGTIQTTLGKLESEGLIVNPPTRQARMRRLTQKGTNALKREHLL